MSAAASTVTMKLLTCVLLSIFFYNVNAMTRDQMKNTGLLMKKNCMPKYDVTEEQVGDIDKGKFLEEKNVMCYIACIYSVGQVVKNDKFILDNMLKQVDMIYPAEEKDDAKAAMEKCRSVAKQYKDICEASFWTAKCIYEQNPKMFFFP